MFKLYELTEGQTSWSSKLIAQGYRNVLGKIMNTSYNTLRTRAGSRVRTIYAIYDINNNLISATGPR